MIILVTSATGTSATALAAYDAALVRAGVADRNLIYLTSVLPPGSLVESVTRIACSPGEWGDRLYCVAAHGTAERPGTQVWAGIGWAQDDTGRGLLVQHVAADEATLRRIISASLDGLERNRGLRLPMRGDEVAGVCCVGEPVSAVAVAVYEAAAWISSAARARQRVPV